MRGPQLEDGFTRIANEILEVVSKVKLNGTQFKILLTIWRYTYGFNRKSSEFSLNFLSEATNSNKQQVKRELDRLIEDKVIIVVKEANFNTSRELSFNKNYSEWKAEGIQSIKIDTVSKLEYSTVSEKAYTTVSELEYQERNIKDNIKKDTITTISERLEENPDNFTANDIGTDPIQQKEESVARVDADSTKQFSPVSRMENYYLHHVRKRTMCSSNDMRDMVHVYDTYKDLEFILGVLQVATKENIRRNGKCKINSFSYFIPILEEEWKKKNRLKEGEKIEPVPRDSKKSYRYDLSGFLWDGGE